MIESTAPELLILPLGGCGEVGLNATLFVAGDDALLVDCGVLLSVDAPGVERVIPDFSVLKRFGRKLHGVVVTHGHEDHIGAIPDLLRAIDAPVYGPPLAMLLLESRLEASTAANNRLERVPLGSTLDIGPFQVETIRMTHSLPDSSALVIETKAGRVFHSGDFKLDPHPIDGLTTDFDRLKAAGDKGIDLAMCDSTNSERHGRTRSESTVGVELERLALETEGLMVVACFASHLHRLEGIARAAAKSGRRIALYGRSLHRSWEVGAQSGHLMRDAALIDDDSGLERLDRNKTILVVTGTQGEPRAALARIAYAPKMLDLQAGDKIVFSATAIPGNERAVRKVINALSATGAEVIVDGMRPVHCSGHAHREEQHELLQLIRPKGFIPLHGERAMLEAHARTARAAGVPHDRIHILENGCAAVLSGGRVYRGGEEHVGRTAIDLFSGREISWEAIERRRKIGMAGLVVCALSPSQARVSLIGLPPSGELALRLEKMALEEKQLGGDDEWIRGVLRRAVNQALGVKPVVEVLSVN